MYLKPVLWVLFLAAAIQSPAQLIGGGEEIPYPNWTVSISPKTNLNVGDILTLTFKGIPADNWHLYSAVLPKNGAFKPTTFQLDADAKGVRLAGPLTDQGEKKTYFDDILEGDIVEFKHDAIFLQRVQLTGKQIRLKGTLKYQYCTTEGKCVYGDEPVDIRLTAAEGTAEELPTDQKAEEYPDTAKKKTPVSNAAPVPPGAGTRSVAEFKAGKSVDILANACEQQREVNYFLLFFQALGLGFIALFTPCVFPIIPATVSFFTKQSETRAAGRRNGIFFTGSIIFMFVGLGLLITLLVGEDALYNISINPWVNLVFFALLVVFALSFLGLFDISLPSSWSTRADAMSGRAGLIGIFFMALTTVVASFSCTGPLIGTALASASQAPLGAFFIMLGFAIGFGVPFGLFAAFPGLMNSLPKSGGWMNAVKVTLGLLELALAFKFLSLADLAWNDGVGFLSRDVFLVVWVVVFLTLAFYLFGWVRFPHDYTKLERLSVFRGLLAMFSLGFALYLLPGLWGAPLGPLSGYLPPQARNHWSKAGTETGPVGEVGRFADRTYLELFAEETPEGFDVFYDLGEALLYAREVNKPVFVDFTGFTCANCRQMERNVWPDPAIRNILNEHYVMVSLFVDSDEPLPQPFEVPFENGTVTATTVGEKWKYYQQYRFGKISQPLYVLLDPHTQCSLYPEEAGRGYNESSSVEKFKAYLEGGLTAHKKLFLQRQAAGKTA